MPLIPFIDLFNDEWPDIHKGILADTVRAPRVDVYEEGNNMVVELEMPGVDPNDINVEVERDVVKIEARTEKTEEEKKKGYFRHEMSSRYYKRAIPLPVDVKESDAQADYEKGVLKIVVPKVEPKKKEDKKVKVKVKSKE